MESSKHLAIRFKEVLLNGTWIANTNYQNILSDITWQQATQKIKSLNSIYALTFHINYYLAGILQVFKGGNLEIKDKFSFDCPKLQSQKDWNHLLAELKSNAEEFAQLIEFMTEEQLDAEFVDKKYGSYRRNIEGTIEHCYYHLGQISLIKKLIQEEK